MKGLPKSSGVRVGYQTEVYFYALNLQPYRHKAMKVTVVIVPPGGGEAQYSLPFELPGIPQPGDYISVFRPNQSGSEDFIVRRTWWTLEYPETHPVVTGEGPSGKLLNAYVESEISLGPNPSERHRKSAESYQNMKPFEETAY